MAFVLAHVSGCSVSRVLRRRWSHEIQLHELDFLVTLHVNRDAVLALSAPDCSLFALGLGRREKSNERCRSVQRKVLSYLSRSIWPVWASFLPVYGRTRRILWRRLYVVWADSDP